MAILPALTIGATVAGTVMTAAGQIQQGKSAAAQGKSMQAAEDYNARILTENAAAIQSAADLDIARQRKAAAKLKSTQRAAYGKSGVLLEGSPTEVLIDSAAEAEMDISITQFNADVEKRAKLSDARYRTFLGQKYAYEGEQAQEAATWGAGTTLLTGATDIMSKYIPWKGKK